MILSYIYVPVQFVIASLQATCYQTTFCAARKNFYYVLYFYTSVWEKERDTDKINIHHIIAVKKQTHLQSERADAGFFTAAAAAMQHFQRKQTKTIGAECTSSTAQETNTYYRGVIGRGLYIRVLTDDGV